VPAGRWGECGTKGGRRSIPGLPVLDDLEDDVSLDLEEQLLTRVDVIVVALVRSADDHDLEVRVLEDQDVADRRLQQAPVFIDPSFEIERCQCPHDAPPENASQDRRSPRCPTTFPVPDQRLWTTGPWTGMKAMPQSAAVVD